MNKKILLLGGNGYVGSRLYDHLLSLNYDVTNVDICWYNQIYKETVVTDYDLLTKDYIQQFTHIILLAGHSIIAMCKTLGPCFENNVSKYIRLIEKMNDSQILIYSSTAAVYGSNDNLVDESHPITNPINFYDYTKICNEQIMSLYPNKKMVGLRFGSIGGFSKNIRNENLLNSLSTNAFKNNKINVSNPEKMRSILDIKDLCKGMISLIEGGDPKNKIYNWTSINGKIIDFGNSIQKITGCELEVNNLFNTNYSFNCSNKLFEKDYNFKFEGTVESIYNDIIENYDKIVVNIKRESKD
jgi:nucleoside-diphosphate-sugar epimerase